MFDLRDSINYVVHIEGLVIAGIAVENCHLPHQPPFGNSSAFRNQWLSMYLKVFLIKKWVLKSKSPSVLKRREGTFSQPKQLLADNMNTLWLCTTSWLWIILSSDNIYDLATPRWMDFCASVMDLSALPSSGIAIEACLNNGLEICIYSIIIHAPWDISIYMSQVTPQAELFIVSLSWFRSASRLFRITPCLTSLTDHLQDFSIWGMLWGKTCMCMMTNEII